MVFSFDLIVIRSSHLAILKTDLHHQQRNINDGLANKFYE